MRPVKIGELVLNFELQRAVAAGRLVRLPGRQWQLIEALGLCAGTMVTREYLLACIYPDPQQRPSLRSLDVLAHHVRAKLAGALGGQNYIPTVRKEGFMLRAPASS